MTPGVLADYLRTIATYGLVTAATAGAGYELISGNPSSPLIPIAGTLLGSVIGVHFSGGIAGSSSPASPVARVNAEVKSLPTPPPTPPPPAA